MIENKKLSKINIKEGLIIHWLVTVRTHYQTKKIYSTFSNLFTGPLLNACKINLVK